MKGFGWWRKRKSSQTINAPDRVRGELATFLDELERLLPRAKQPKELRRQRKRLDTDFNEPALTQYALAVSHTWKREPGLPPNAYPLARFEDQFEALKREMPLLAVALCPVEKQRLGLYRAFLNHLLDDLQRRLGAIDNRVLYRLAALVDRAPDRVGADSFPEGLALGDFSEIGWGRWFIKLNNYLFELVALRLGDKVASQRFEATYQFISDVYQHLPTVNQLVFLIPDPLLDTDRVKKMSSEQLSGLLLQKVKHLEYLNDTLAVRNEALGRARDELKRAKIESDALGKRLDAVIQTVNEGLITIDVNSTIVMVNSMVEQMWGYPASDLLGKPLEILMPPAYRARHEAGMRRYLETRVPQVLGKKVRMEGARKDGSIFPLEINIAETKVGDQMLFTAAVADISEKLAQEAQLAENNAQLEVRVRERTRELEEARRRLARRAEDLTRSNQDLEQFAFFASHDLQEPLRSIVSFAQLLERKQGPEADPTTREYLGFIIKGGLRMNALIKDLLTYSRVGRSELTLQPVQLELIVRQAWHFLHQPVTETEAQLEVGKLPEISVDSIRMTQVFQNLFENSIKFRTDKKPHITVTARELTDSWEIGVADNGIGIESAQRERIFRMFERLEGGSRHVGSGLGLAIVDKIVGRHGGRVRVEGNETGGSTFYLQLPKA